MAYIFRNVSYVLEIIILPPLLFMFMIYVIYLLPTYMAYVCDKNATTTRNEIAVNNEQKVSCKLLR